MIPHGFPYSLSDDELERAITDAIDGTGTGLWPQSSVFPAEPYHLIELGLVEQARRELHSASKIAKLALAVAVLSSLSSIITLLVAACG